MKRARFLTTSNPALAAVALAAASVAAAPAAAIAQQAPDTFDLREIVVTATRLPIARASTPAAVTVISGDDLRARGIERVSDALREVPGAAVVESGPTGSVSTLFLRGGEADYVKVLVDGVPVNEPGGRFDFSTLSTANVERIEVVRGPASVLYGSDAMSGVVQVFTRSGGTRRADASLRVGSYGALEWDASAAGGSRRASFSAGVARQATDGTLPFNNDFANLSASGAGRLRFGLASDIAVTARYTDADYHYPTDGSGAIVDTNALQETRRLSLGVDAGHRFGDAFELRLLLGSARLESDMEDAQDTPADTLGMYAYGRRQELTRGTADLRGNLYLSSGLVLTAGGSIEREREATTDSARSEWGPSESAFTARRTNRALYLQSLATPTDRVSLTLGVRLDDNEKFGSFGTWRAGGALGVTPSTHLRASVGTAFKEPTFLENFSSVFTIGNPSLEPERSRSLEVGIEQAIGGHGQVGVTAFRQRFRDLIQYTYQTPGPGAPNYYNIAAARADGIEISGAASFGFARLTASYTRLDTEVTDAGFDEGADAAFVAGDRLLRRPRHSGSIAFDAHPTERLDLGLVAHLVGRRDDLDYSGWPAKRVELARYQRLDASASYELVEKRGGRPSLSLTLRATNLADRDYQEIAGFRAPGRTLLVGGRISG